MAHHNKGLWADRGLHVSYQPPSLSRSTSFPPLFCNPSCGMLRANMEVWRVRRDKRNAALIWSTFESVSPAVSVMVHGAYRGDQRNFLNVLVCAILTCFAHFTRSGRFCSFPLRREVIESWFYLSQSQKQNACVSLVCVHLCYVSQQCRPVGPHTQFNAGEARGEREESSDKARGLKWEWHYFRLPPSLPRNYKDILQSSQNLQEE